MPPLLDDLQRNGFADLGETDPTLATHEVALTLAKTLGAVVIAPPDALSVSAVGSKPLNTYGGNYGSGELPLHTDLAHWYRPPRYVVLRCLVASAAVATRVFDHKKLDRYIPLALMRRATFTPRRRLDGKTFLLRMLTDEIFRWDSLFLQPQNPSAREVLELMLRVAPALPVTSIVQSGSGHTLLMDNWRVLHGRSAVPTADMDRQIERVYMESRPDGN